jgi:TPR repeat protein
MPARPASSDQKLERIVTAPAAAEVIPPAAQAASPSIPAGSAAIVTRGDQPKSAQSAATPPRYTAPGVTSLLSRGDAMLSLGDISAARLLYERAAALGSARAATAVGKTFDPAFLAAIHASVLRPDPAAAASWYRKAAGRQ